MRTLIEVSCVDQDLEVTTGPLIASGGLHENFVKFEFCPLWDGFTKTAVFYRNIKNPYYMLLDENDECEIPHEVTDASGVIYFGVFGVLGDVTRTSKLLRYPVKQGAITPENEPYAPTPDVWEQLLEAYNSILSEVEASNQSQNDFIKEQTEIMESQNEEMQTRFDAQDKKIDDFIATGGSVVQLDESLKEKGKAADAKAVGDAIGEINMKYDPTTDIRYLKNQDGEWVEVGYGGLLDKYLYSGSSNEAEFVGFAGGVDGVTYAGDAVPSVTIGPSLTVRGTAISGCAISKLIDFTEYSKLVFYHNSNVSKNDYSGIHICITSDKSKAMTKVFSKLLCGAGKQVEGREEIDVSGIDGSYYLVIHVANNLSGGATSISVSDMYLSR